jgi:aminomethyltransferase
MALAGFNPISDFGDAKAEARACRSDCALFDFSFLEAARISGARAKDVIEAYTGRSLGSLGVGRIHYALRVDPAGHVRADLTVWRTGPDAYEVMSGRREDVSCLMDCSDPDVEVADLSEQMTAFALQGPRSLEVLRRLGHSDMIAGLDYFAFADATLDGVPCRIGRLGYTGEAGFEILLNRNHGRDLWRTLSAHARPAGFIAADMLRIEAGFVLFTNEFRMAVSPEEAGLARFFPQRDIAAPQIALVSFRATAARFRLPWEPNAGLQRPGSMGEIVVTSACHSIAAGGILGLGYVRADCEPGVRLHDPAGVFTDIRRVGMPFYDPGKSRPRQPWSPSKTAPMHE